MNNIDKLDVKSRVVLYPYEYQVTLIDRAHKRAMENRINSGLSPISKSKWLIDRLMVSMADSKANSVGES
tara:strand:+ start:935 stop:1144 length:210 start_codon:yes stop_codon:yes gene_type:complete